MEYHISADEETVDMPEIPGFKDKEPMDQFIAQVDLCVDCTTGCLKGLANVHVSPFTIFTIWLSLY